MASARYTLNIKQEDLKPEEEVALSPKEKRANWLHSHKWWIIGIAFFVILIGWIIHDVVTKIDPDYTIAVVTVNPLSDEVLTSLEDALQPYLEDVDGDGHTVANVVHYSLNYEDAELNNQQEAQLRMASELQMSTDLSTSTSIIFITDSFFGMQDNIGIFAFLDDPYSYPADDERGDYDRMSVVWGDSAFLTGLELTGPIYDIGTGQTVQPQEFFADFRVVMRTLYDPEDEELMRSFSSCVDLMSKIRGVA